MKIFAAILVLLITSTAVAQVPASCRPTKLADVNMVGAGDDFAGWWWCDSTKASYAWRGVLKPAITRDMAALAYAFAVTGDQRIFDQVTALQDSDPSLAALRAAVIADVAAKRPQFVVAKNGTYPDRPAYPVANGVRDTTLTGRATVGAPCDCSLLVTEGTTRYCRASGPLVAVCVAKQ